MTRQRAIVSEIGCATNSRAVIRIPFCLESNYVYANAARTDTSQLDMESLMLRTLTPLDQQIIAWIRAAAPFAGNAPPSVMLDNITWQALLERAQLQGVAPLLDEALSRHASPNVPAFIAERLCQIGRASALATAVAQHELQRLLGAFAAQELQPIVLKGAALSRWLYPSPGLRPFGDVDLVIHAADRAAASAVLTTAGYAEALPETAAFRDTFTCETVFNRISSPRLSVDLHWHIINATRYRRRIPIEWFWERAQPLDFGSVTGLVFNPTAQLVHLALHLGLHHASAPRLIHLYDIALLVHKYAAVIDWRAAATFAQTTEIARPVYTVLLQTQTAWGVAPSPENLALFRPRGFQPMERIAFQFITATHGEGAVLTNALSVPGVGNKLQYARRHLFPDAAYMRQHYALAPNAFLPYYYARRLVTSGWKFLRSVWSAFLG